MDYAILTIGSAFTVGVANTALIRVMAAAPEHSHKMAVTVELDRKMAGTTVSHSANPVSSQYAADRRESSLCQAKP